MTRRRRWHRLLALVPFGVLVAACGGGDTLPVGDRSSSIDVVVGAAGVDIDRRVLGTNLPAWLGPERLADPEFQRLTVESGTTLLRMPGGSWSNSYDWLACETGDEDACFWTWAARPTDFVDFLQATGIEGMWTVSINETAQAAAAAVAFFNGAVDDETVIGVDRDDVDWATVGQWAQLRRAAGNPEPIGIGVWEVGNEVFGGTVESAGSECSDFGWEDVWTCDGTEYVTGTAEHDGYADIRAAMRAVDPNIQVGAVGVDDAGAWGNWGNEVIDGTIDELDFYIVHDYGFDASPDPSDAVDAPRRRWPRLAAELRADLGDVPVAITEYNLVSFEAGDTEQTMTHAANALYIADTIGQFATQEIAIANQWNLANGITSSGTDYGMINVDGDAGYTLYPQYEAMAMWSRTGSTLLDVEVSSDEVGVYPTRHDDGRMSLVMVNRSGVEASLSLTIAGDHGDVADLVTVAADDPTDITMTSSTLTVIVDGDGVLSPVLPPWSIATLHLTPPESSDA